MDMRAKEERKWDVHVYVCVFIYIDIDISFTLDIITHVAQCDEWRSLVFI